MRGAEFIVEEARKALQKSKTCELVKISEGRKVMIAYGFIGWRNMLIGTLRYVELDY